MSVSRLATAVVGVGLSASLLAGDTRPAVRPEKRISVDDDRRAIAQRVASCVITFVENSPEQPRNADTRRTTVVVHANLERTPQAVDAMVRNEAHSAPVTWRNQEFEAYNVSGLADPRDAIDTLRIIGAPDLQSFRDDEMHPAVILNPRTGHTVGTRVVLFAVERAYDTYGDPEAHRTLSTGYTYCGALVATAAGDQITWQQDPTAPSVQDVLVEGSFP